MSWLAASELRVGLGCMRLSTDADRDQQRALDTIAAACDAGITVFDTAHAYGQDATELGHNERLLARALRRCGGDGRARVVTKGGMRRAGSGWVPDGRAGVIQRDCEASLRALNGLPIDLYLVHAPDPRTPWPTTVRALHRLLDDQLVGHVGVANVNLRQLTEACQIAPISAVQVSLSPFDIRALRGGLVEQCRREGITLMAHAPLGGTRRAGGLTRHVALAAVAERHGATVAEVALAWLLGLSPLVIPIPGARRPETARSAARAADLRLTAAEQESLATAFGSARPVRRSRPVSSSRDAEVVLIMGIPGAGKSRIAQGYASRGYVQLNRDARGGSLRDLSAALDADLTAGARRLVLDNTWLSRAARSHVIDAAHRHGYPIRCVWLDTPLAQAQVNLVERLLGRFDELPSPEQLRVAARLEPGLLTPTQQMRTVRELEEPSTEEGFSSVERLDFVRSAAQDAVRGAVFVAAAALQRPGWERFLQDCEPGAPHLVFEWRPDGSPSDLAAAVASLSALVSGPVESAICPHPAGPPVCWCRPPLPGLPLAFARAHRLNPQLSTLIGAGPAHRSLAAALQARYIGEGSTALRHT